MRRPLESLSETVEKRGEKIKGTLSTVPEPVPISSNPGAIPRVHKYLPSILNGHISWGGKKSERPSEIQRLNPSLGSRQYSERSIKACLPDVPFRSRTYTSIELSSAADITHQSDLASRSYLPPCPSSLAPAPRGLSGPKTRD